MVDEAQKAPVEGQLTTTAAWGGKKQKTCGVKLFQSCVVYFSKRAQHPISQHPFKTTVLTTTIS